MMEHPVSCAEITCLWLNTLCTDGSQERWRRLLLCFDLTLYRGALWSLHIAPASFCSTSTGECGVLCPSDKWIFIWLFFVAMRWKRRRGGGGGGGVEGEGGVPGFSNINETPLSGGDPQKTLLLWMVGTD